MREEKRSGDSRRKSKPVSLRQRLLRARPQADRVVIVAIASLALFGIPLNALFLQDGRHPAPLFQSSIHIPTVAEHAPLPPPRPLDVAPARPAPVKTNVVNSDAAQPNVAHSNGKMRDPIGLLLAGDAPKAEEIDKKALFAQRALAKLGYNIRADGKFGGSTRQAIEKFERDSGLPVKGELTAKIMRQLTSRSGVPIE